MDKKYKKEGFNVPEGYFDSLSKRLMNQMKEEKQGLPNKEGFGVPEGYFENFNDRLKERMDLEGPKVVQLNPLRKFYFVAASIAALIIIVIGLRWGSTDELSFGDLANSELETYLDENEIELTSYELAEVIPVEELEVNDILDNNLKDENIIDYLDENVDDLDELNIEFDE